MSENYVITVTVATASAIIVSQQDPYRVLVADSAKHPKPVISGGKIEHDDIGGSLSAAGLRCILREVEEEVGTQLTNAHYIGVATDPERDVRNVPFSKIKSAVTNPVLDPNTPLDTRIKASYGCPDYIYTGTVDEAAIKTTEELSGLRFIDIRALGVNDLSAGHDVIVLLYREMSDAGRTQLPEDSMQDFAIDRRRLELVRHNPKPSSTEQEPGGVK